MKGLLQKIIGIIGVFIVLGTVVMVTLTPRREGFFPDMFTSEKNIDKVPPEIQIEPAVASTPTPTPTPTLPEATCDTLPVPDESTESSDE